MNVVEALIIMVFGAVLIVWRNGIGRAIIREQRRVFRSMGRKAELASIWTTALIGFILVVAGIIGLVLLSR